MDSEESSVQGTSGAAESAFAEFLRRRAQEPSLDLGAFCAERPALAREIRILEAFHSEAASAAKLPSLADLIRDRFGQDVEVTFVLDPDANAKMEDAPAARSFPAALLTPSPGHTQRYAFRGEIARGGMGVILKVRDEVLQRSLAMKVILKASEAADPSARTHVSLLGRFLEEAQVTAQLDHPGVVPVHELGMDASGRLFFVMKLVKGSTLSEIIPLARTRTDGWTLTRALQVFLRICETLAFAHEKGVIHRDLKPANIMVGRHGEVYVMDWGLAKVTGQADRHDIRVRGEPAESVSRIRTDRADQAADPGSPLITMDGSVVGTPCYMPPEQAMGRVEAVNERSDVYAVGAMLYELLSGEAPYVSKGARISPHTLLACVIQGPPRPVNEIDPTAPDELQAIAEKAMAREPSDRYGSMEQLRQDLQSFIEGRVVRAHRTGAVVELKKWVQRNKPLAASAAAAVLFLLLGAVVSLFYAGEARLAEDAARAETQNARAAEAEAQTQKGRAEEQRLAAERGLAEARRNLALFHWEAGDRAYGEKRFREASAQYLEAIGLGAEKLDAEFLEGKKQASLAAAAPRGRLAGALALSPGAPEPLCPQFRSAAIAPGGSLLAAASEDGRWIAAWKLPELELQELVPADSLKFLFFVSPRRLLTISEGSLPRLAAVELPGGEVRGISTLQSPCQAAVLFPDRNRLAVGRLDGAVQVIEASSGSVVRELAPPPAPATASWLGLPLRPVEVMAADASGGKLLAWGDDQVLRLWDIASGRETASRKLEDRLVAVDFLGPDRLVLWNDRGLFETTLSLTGELRPIHEGALLDCVRLGAESWFVVTPERCGELAPGREPELDPLPQAMEWVRALRRPGRAFKSIGEQSTAGHVATEVGGTLLVHDRSRGAWRARAGRIIGSARLQRFSSDASVLAAVGNLGTSELGPPVEIYDLRTPGSSRLLRAEGSASEVTALDLSGDGRRLITSDAKNTLRLYELPEGRLAASGPAAVEGPVAGLAFSRDATVVYVIDAIESLAAHETARLGTAIAQAHLWENAEQRQRILERRQAQRAVTDSDRLVLRVHPDGAVVIGGGEDRILIRDGRDLKIRGSLPLEKGGVVDITVSGQIGFVAALHANGDVLVWPSLSRDELYWSLGREPGAISGAFSRTGEVFAVGKSSGEVVIFDLFPRQERDRMDTGSRGIYAIAFSADEHSLLVQGSDRGPMQIRLPGRRAMRLQVPGVTSISTHPTRNQVALLTGIGGTIVLDLDLPNSPPCHAMVPFGTGKRGALYDSVRFSPDGAHLLVARSDGGLVVFEMQREVEERGNVEYNAVLVSQSPPSGEQDASPAWCVHAAGAESKLFRVREQHLEVLRFPGLTDPERLLPLPALRFTQLAVSPDGKYCTLGAMDCEVILVDLSQRKVLWQRQCPHLRPPFEEPDFVVSLEFSRDSNAVAAAVSTGERLSLFKGPEGTALGGKPLWTYCSPSVVFSKEHEVRLAASAQLPWLLVSCPSLEEPLMLDLEPPAANTKSVALLADGSAAVVLDGEGRVQVVPLDLDVFRLDGEALRAHVTRRLSGGTVATQDLRDSYRFQPLE